MSWQTAHPHHVLTEGETLDRRIMLLGIDLTTQPDHTFGNLAVSNRPVKVWSWGSRGGSHDPPRRTNNTKPIARQAGLVLERRPDWSYSVSREVGAGRGDQACPTSIRDASEVNVIDSIATGTTPATGRFTTILWARAICGRGSDERRFWRRALCFEENQPERKLAVMAGRASPSWR